MPSFAARISLGSLLAVVACGGDDTSTTTGAGGAGSTTTTTTTSTASSSDGGAGGAASTASSSDGGAGGGTGGATGGPAPEACNMCSEKVEATCDAETAECKQDPDCKLWLACTSECFEGDFTAACFEACDAANANGSAKYGPLRDCACGQCAAECPALCTE